jgi:hypothetical protein
MTQDFTFLGMGTPVVVKANAKAGEIALMALRHLSQKLRFGTPLFLSPQHNGRSVGIVGAHINSTIALGTLKSNPNVSLHVLNQVSQMNMAIGVGQGARNKNSLRGVE